MRRFVAKLRNAASGIAHALRVEPHMRIHAAATALVCLVAALLRVSAFEWALLLALCGLVVTAELINTAIERTVDLATKERHPLAKAAKDTASGAVLAAVLFAIAAGAIVFIPHLWRVLQHALD